MDDNPPWMTNVLFLILLGKPPLENTTKWLVSSLLSRLRESRISDTSTSTTSTSSTYCKCKTLFIDDECKMKTDTTNHHQELSSPPKRRLHPKMILSNYVQHRNRGLFVDIPVYLAGTSESILREPQRRNVEADNKTTTSFLQKKSSPLCVWGS